ncbi:MAG: hypothetical protein CMJ78_24250 [Planctomycetaceae bacterium]|nr:hypothetical protein [Planctomycetaceae bacterium]
MSTQRETTMKRTSRFVSCVVLCALLGGSFLKYSGYLAPARADEAIDRSEEEEAFQSKAARYQKVLSRRPRQGTAFDLLYRHYLDAGRVDELIEHYQRSVKENAEDAAPHLLLGLVLQRRSRDDEALAELSKAIEFSKESFHPRYYKAMLLGRLHRGKDAITELVKLTESETQAATRTEIIDVYKRLGQLYVRQDQIDDALKTWNALADKYPTDRFTLQELARLLTEAGQYDEAIERNKQLIVLAKQQLHQQLKAKLEIGRIQGLQGKTKQSLATFEKCLDELKPGSWQANDIRQRIENVFLNRSDEAGLGEYYRKRLLKHPDDLDARIRLARTTSRLGKVTDAIKQYREAIDQAPTRIDIRESLVDELTRTRRFSMAIDEINAILKVEPKNTDWLTRLGQLYLDSALPNQREEYQKKALAAWSRIPEIRPDDPLLSVQVAELCRKAVRISAGFGEFTNRSLNAKRSETDFGRAALKAYEDAVRKSSGVPQYREYLGEFFFAIGENNLARAQWELIAAGPNGTAENWKRVAEILSRAELLKPAISAIQKAISQDSKRYDLHVLAAEYEMLDGNYDNALGHVDQMEALAESSYFEEQALMQRVEIYEVAERTGTVFRELNEKLSNTKGSVRDYWLASIIASGDQRFSVAIQLIDKAIVGRPEGVRLLRFKANLLRETGDLSNAIKQFQMLAKLEPRNQSAHLRELIQLQLELGQGQKARETARQLLRLTPGKVESFELLADVEFRTGNVDGGIAVLRRAVQSDPRNSAIRQRLASTLVTNERQDEAIEHMWESFTLADSLEDKLSAVSSLFEQYQMAGETSEMVNRLNQLRRRQTDEFDLILCLARLYIMDDNFTEARKELSMLLIRHPNNVPVLSALAELSTELDDLDSAKRYLERLVALSGDMRYLQRLAETAERLGDDELADDLWLRIARASNSVDDIIRDTDIFFRDSNYRQVIAIGEAGLTRFPQDHRLLYRLAIAHFASNNVARAGELTAAILKLPRKDLNKPFVPNIRNQTLATYGGPVVRPSVFNHPAIARYRQLPIEMRSQLSYLRSRNIYTSRPLWISNNREDTHVRAICLQLEIERESPNYEDSIEALEKASKSSIAAAEKYLIHTTLTLSPNWPEAVDRWIALDDMALAARLVKLSSITAPTLFYSNAGPPEVSSEKWEEIKVHYGWLQEHHPKIAGKFVPMYLFYASQKEKQKLAELAKPILKHISSAIELQTLSSLYSGYNDADLDALMLDRIKQLMTDGEQVTDSVLATFYRSAMRKPIEKGKIDAYLDLLTEFVNSTHPSRTDTQGMYAQMRSQRPTTSSKIPLNRLPAFPQPSFWMPISRFYFVRDSISALQKQGKLDSLTKRIEQQVAQSEDVRKESWQLMLSMTQWRQGRTSETIKTLTQLYDASPKDPELSMMMALATANSGDSKEALKYISDLPGRTGMSAVEFEKTRLSLALRADNKEVAKESAMRLFGMRLSTNHRIELSQTLRRMGLKTESDALLSRSVRHASSQTGDLVKLLNDAIRTDPARTVSIAKSILKRAPRNFAPKTSRSSRSSSSSTTNSSPRKSAIRALQQVGQLSDYIKGKEKQSNSNHRSIRLLEDLWELYTAVGNTLGRDNVRDRLRFHPRLSPELALLVSKTYTDVKESVKWYGVIWRKNPDLLLSNRNVFSYYMRGDNLPLLAKHLRLYHKRRTPSRYENNVSSMITNLSSSDIDEVSDIYLAMIESPNPYTRWNYASRFVNFLTSKNRKQRVYTFLRSRLLPDVDGKIEWLSRPSKYIYDAYCRQLATYVNLAAEPAFRKDIEKSIETSVARDPSWKSMAAFATAILKNSSGDDKALANYAAERMDKGSLNAAEDAINQQLFMLLEHHQNPLAAAVGLDFLDRFPNVVVTGSSYIAANPIANMQRRAALLVRLGKRDEARKVYLDGIKKFENKQSSYNGMYNAVPNATDQIALAMAGLGFETDALFLHAKANVSRLKLANPSLARSSTYRNPRTRIRSALKKLNMASYGSLADRLTEAVKNRESLDEFFFGIAPNWAESVNVSSSRLVTFSSSPQMMSQIQPVSGVLSSSLPTANRFFEAQFLPTLIGHSRTTGKIGDLVAAIEKRQAGPEEQRIPEDQLQALNILLALNTSLSSKANQLMSDWAAKLWERPTSATPDYLPMIAEAAIRSKTTTAEGVKLMLVAARRALADNNPIRQRWALGSVVFAMAREGEGSSLHRLAQKEVSKLPASIWIECSVGLYKQKSYAAAITFAELALAKQPELMMASSTAPVYQVYLQAGKYDQLARILNRLADDGIDKRVGSLSSSFIRGVFSAAKSTKVPADKAKAIVNASLRCLPERYRTGQVASYLSFLQSRGLNSDAYKVMRAWVLPGHEEIVPKPIGYSSALRFPMNQLYVLAASSSGVSNLEADVKKARQDHPEWSGPADLMSAIIQLHRGGHEEPLVKVADRFFSDAAYASTLQPYAADFRNQLTTCESRKAAEYAIRLWKDISTQYSSSSMLTFDNSSEAQENVTKLLVKLGRRDEAREVAMSAIELFARRYTTRTTYDYQMRAAKIRVDKLVEYQFDLDAAYLAELALRLEPEGVSTSSTVMRSIVPSIRKSQVEVLKRLMFLRLNESLAELFKELEGPANVRRFFTVHDLEQKTTPKPITVVLHNYLGPPEIEPQFLIALLSHAKNVNQLDQLKAAVNSAMKRLPKQGFLKELALAIDLVKDAPSGDQLKQYVDGLPKDRIIVESNAAWHIAMIGSRHKAQRPAVSRLLQSVHKDALLRGNKDRAVMVLQQLAIVDPDSEAISESIGNINLTPTMTPQEIIKTVDLAIQSNRKATALDTLNQIWERHPDTVFLSLSKYATIYQEQGRLPELAKHLRGIYKTSTKTRFSYSMGTMFKLLKPDEKSLEEILDLYRAAYQFAEPSRRQNVIKEFVNYVFRVGAVDKSIEVLAQALAPKDNYPGHVVGILDRLLLEAKTDAQKKLVKDVIVANQKATPTWGACGELAFARVAQKSGDEQPLAKIAKLYLTDARYIEALANEVFFLESSLVEANEKASLEQAIRYWTIKKVTRGTSIRSNSPLWLNIGQLARFHARNGDREKARDIIEKALAEPATIGESTNGKAYGELRRKQALGMALVGIGYRFQGWALMESSLEMDVSRLSSRLSLLREIRQVIGNARGATPPENASLNMESSVLLAELESGRIAKTAKQYFVLLDQVPPNRPTNQSIRAMPKALLIQLLEYMKEYKQFEKLEAAMAKAAKAHPGNEHVQRLSLMVQLFAGEDAAVPGLKSVAEAVDKDPNLVKKSDTRLITQLALSNAKYSQFSQPLAMHFVVRPNDASIIDDGQTTIIKQFFEHLKSVNQSDPNSEDAKRIADLVLNAFAKTMDAKDYEFQMTMSHPEIVGAPAAKKIEQKYPDRVKALKEWSLAKAKTMHSKSSERPRALQFWGYLLAHEPKNAYYAYMRAVLHKFNQDWEPCIRDFTVSIDNGRDGINGYYQRGIANRNAKHWKPAMADLRKALELAEAEQKNPVLIWKEMALVEIEQLHHDAAAKYFDEAIKLDPTNSHQVPYWLALVLLDKGDVKGYQQQCAALQSKLRPSDTNAASFVARAFVASPDSTKDWKPVIDLAMKAVQVNSNNFFYQNNLGSAYYRAGKYDDALRALKVSERLRSDSPWNWLFLALTNKKLGNDEAAQKSYKQYFDWWTSVNDAKKVEPQAPSLSLEHQKWHFKIHHRQFAKEAKELFKQGF